MPRSSTDRNKIRSNAETEQEMHTKGVDTAIETTTGRRHRDNATRRAC